MRKHLFTVIFISLSVSFSVGQEQLKTKFHIGIEGGKGGLFGSSSNTWDIRQDVSSRSYYWDSYYSNPSGFTTGDYSYLALKPVYTFGNGRWSIASGISFLNLGTQLGTFGLRADSYFYLRQVKPGETNFFRVSSISEQTGYLNVPIDVSFIPIRFGRKNLFEFYLKAGADFGWKIYSKNKINFVNEKMQQYENEILDGNNLNINNTISTFKFSFLGFRITTPNSMRYYVEFIGPLSTNSKRNSSLMDLSGGTGIHMGWQIPIFLTK